MEDLFLGKRPRKRGRGADQRGPGRKTSFTFFWREEKAFVYGEGKVGGIWRARKKGSSGNSLSTPGKKCEDKTDGG